MLKIMQPLSQTALQPTDLYRPGYNTDQLLASLLPNHQFVNATPSTVARPDLLQQAKMFAREVPISLIIHDKRQKENNPMSAGASLGLSAEGAAIFHDRSTRLFTGRVSPHPPNQRRAGGGGSRLAAGNNDSGSEVLVSDAAAGTVEKAIPVSKAAEDESVQRFGKEIEMIKVLINECLRQPSVDREKIVSLIKDVTFDYKRMILIRKDSIEDRGDINGNAELCRELSSNLKKYGQDLDWLVDRLDASGDGSHVPAEIYDNLFQARFGMSELFARIGEYDASANVFSSALSNAEKAIGRLIAAHKMALASEPERVTINKDEAAIQKDALYKMYRDFGRAVNSWLDTNERIGKELNASDASVRLVRSLAEGAIVALSGLKDRGSVTYAFFMDPVLVAIERIYDLKGYDDPIGLYDRLIQLLEKMPQLSPKRIHILSKNAALMEKVGRFRDAAMAYRKVKEAIHRLGAEQYKRGNKPVLYNAYEEMIWALEAEAKNWERVGAEEKAKGELKDGTFGEAAQAYIRLADIHHKLALYDVDNEPVHGPHKLSPHFALMRESLKLAGNALEQDAGWPDIQEALDIYRSNYYKGTRWSLIPVRNYVLELWGMLAAGPRNFFRISPHSDVEVFVSHYTKINMALDAVMTAISGPGKKEEEERLRQLKYRIAKHYTWALRTGRRQNVWTLAGRLNEWNRIERDKLGLPF